MSYFFARIKKMGFYIFIPLLFISNGRSGSVFGNEGFLYSSYTLNEESVKKELNGKVYYETILETSNRGIQFSVIKLYMLNGEGEDEYSMEFVISKQNKTNPANSRGTYMVHEKGSGFLNSFNGVFGHADNSDFGETLFFVKKGKISILEIEDDMLQGNMKLTLEDEKGKEIAIKGSFTAENKTKIQDRT